MKIKVKYEASENQRYYTWYLKDLGLTQEEFCEKIDEFIVRFEKFKKYQ